MMMMMKAAHGAPSYGGLGTEYDSQVEGLQPFTYDSQARYCKPGLAAEEAQSLESYLVGISFNCVSCRNQLPKRRRSRRPV